MSADRSHTVASAEGERPEALLRAVLICDLIDSTAPITESMAEAGVMTRRQPTPQQPTQPVAPPPDQVLVKPPTSAITNSRDGVVLAFDVWGLVTLAGRADCVLELVPQVGDFVAAGFPERGQDGKAFDLFHPRQFRVARRDAMGYFGDDAGIGGECGGGSVGQTALGRIGCR